MTKEYRRRVGFTLIELLVVIAIIGTLIGLLIPAVMKARIMGYRTNTTIELTQLDAACKAFYAKYNFYPPSKITIGAGMTAADTAILKRMFPRCSNPAAVTWGVSGTLSGDECLVFFLGGVNVGGMPKGFNQDPTNPGATGGGTFDPPFFNFQSGRLIANASGNLAYADYYRTNKYAFFSSTNNSYANSPSDCSALGVAPYQSAAGVFIRPDTVQIICAGPDRVFGPGGTVLTSGGGSALPPAAQDDQANFAGSGLGGY